MALAVYHSQSHLFMMIFGSLMRPFLQYLIVLLLKIKYDKSKNILKKRWCEVWAME